MSFTADDICDYFLMRKPWPKECIDLLMSNRVDYGSAIYKSPTIVSNNLEVLYFRLQNETLSEKHIILYEGASKFMHLFLEQCKPILERKYGPLKYTSLCKQDDIPDSISMFSGQLIQFLTRSFAQYSEFMPGIIAMDLMPVLASEEAELSTSNFGHSRNIRNLTRACSGYLQNILYKYFSKTGTSISDEDRLKFQSLKRNLYQYGHSNEPREFLKLLIEYVQLTNPDNPLLADFPIMRGNKIIKEPTVDDIQKQIVDLLMASVKSDTSIFVLDHVSIQKFLETEHLEEWMNSLIPADISSARNTGKMLNLSVQEIKTYMRHFGENKEISVETTSDFDFI